MRQVTADRTPAVSFRSQQRVFVVLCVEDIDFDQSRDVDDPGSAIGHTERIYSGTALQNLDRFLV